MSDSYEAIRILLESTKPEEVHQGLELVRHEIARVGSQEAKSLFEMVSSLFYIDPLDRSDLKPILDEAISLVVGFGAWVIPMLMEKLDAGDIKAQLAISYALGRIGADAIQPLMTEYQARTSAGHRAFVLYALGKIKSPKIVQATPLALEAAQSTDTEVRDTATRVLGKLVESIPPADFPAELRKSFLQRLQQNLGDTNAGVRAKAIRSWGKLARYGHLDSAEREDLQRICRRILGTDEDFEWDRAFIVRREAEEALRHAQAMAL